MIMKIHTLTCVGHGWNGVTLFNPNNGRTRLGSHHFQGGMIF